MVDKKTLVSDLVELTDHGYFLIKKIDFDEENFGNFCIELNSNNQVSIRFIRDKGTFWCEVGKNDEWYFIEDVFSLFGLDTSVEKSDVREFLKYMSKLLSLNTTKILNVFDAKNYEETQFKVKKIATERALKMFKS